MSQSTSNYSSIIARSTHILLIQIESAIFGAWSPAPTGGVWRTVDMTVTLQEVLKGKTEEVIGERVRTDITQWGTGTTRIAGVMGVWSHQSLIQGSQLVAFCQAAGNRVAEMLKDPFCELVLPAERALPDLNLILQPNVQQVSPQAFAQAQVADLAGVLGQAESRVSSLGEVWAEHLWADYAATILETSKNFELLMQFIEQPDLSYVARATLLNLVYGQLVAAPSIPSEFVSRFAITLFRLLGLPQAAALHDNIIDVFLPNLLGLSAGLTERPATDIFRNYPDERQKAEQALLNYQGAVSTTNLLRWLRS